MSKEQEKAARGVDSITDFFRDKEGDAAKALQALKSLTAKPAPAADEKPVAPAIKVSESDVSVIIQECEFSKEQAIDLLRKHDGNLKAALKGYLSHNLQ